MKITPEQAEKLYEVLMNDIPSGYLSSEVDALLNAITAANQPMEIRYCLTHQINPETMAKCVCGCDIRTFVEKNCTDTPFIIESALQKVRNDTIEECALKAETMHIRPTRVDLEDVSYVQDLVASAIRALKSKESESETK